MSTQPHVDPELVSVFETMQESEAMVVHGLLNSAGIESIVSSIEAQQDIWPGVGGVAVRVNAAQAEEARRLIAEYEDSSVAEEGDSELEAETGAEG